MYAPRLEHVIIDARYFKDIFPSATGSIGKVVVFVLLLLLFVIQQTSIYQALFYVLGMLVNKTDHNVQPFEAYILE